MVDGALVRVSRDFDETEGSDDMIALRELLAGIRTQLETDPAGVDLGLVTKHGQVRRS